MTNDNIQQAADLIKNAKEIAVLTGAGVSKESGVPTFRDAMDGLWAKFDPQQLATQEAFEANPKLVWDWYEYRRGLVRGAKPNAGHYALAELEKRYASLTIITQNVDDLHEQAGSKNVIHLHGNIAQSKCFDNCQGDPTLIDLNSYAWDREQTPPPCPHCGAYVRPDVVWFGEMLPLKELDRAKVVSVNCDVMIVVGTSGLVTPAASMPEYARQAGAKIIEVNPDYSMITRIADIKLEGASGEMLPRVIEALG
ncbi:MAG: NAD-dependent deacylase [Aggregatilineales bacterium]